ncbi:MAG: hypothetical protein V1750_07350 [Acidobacteriota bacterium]
MTLRPVMTSVVLAAVWLGWPGAASAGLFGDEVKTYVAPGRLFSAQVPTGWTIREGGQTGKNPDEVQFVPAGPDDAVLHVRRVPVPAGADPIQVALRALDERLSKMPMFKLASKKRVTVAGKKAASITGVYAFQGNLQYPRAIEEVFVVVGEEAFVLHFDCFQAMAASYADAVNRFYQSFTPRPTEGATDDSGEAVPFPEIETMPF